MTGWHAAARRKIRIDARTRNGQALPAAARGGSAVPQVPFGGSQWTIALVRDSTGHLLKAADRATDPRGQVRLLSDDLAEYEGQTGVGVTGTLHRQTDTPAPCGSSRCSRKGGPQ